MKILLDHNLDRRLKNELPGFDVETTQERGWADVLNGELLLLAERNGFDVIITADAHINDQQNIAGRRISILILRALNNRLSTHRAMVGDIVRILGSISPGEIIEVFHPDLPKP